MQKPPNLRFMTANDVVWNGFRDAAQIVVYVDGKRIRCRVSAECLDTHCGAPQTTLGRTEAARGHFDEITKQLTRLIVQRRYEPDGTILLRSSDWFNSPEETAVAAEPG